MSSTPLDVLVVGMAVGLPRGMAATSRVRLYSRALAAAGDRVRIVLTTTSERPPQPLNVRPCGVVDGVPFEYLTGTPVRADAFWRRRWYEARAHVTLLRRLAALRRAGRPCAILGYGGPSHWSLGYQMLTVAARVLGIPLVTDVCEAPWSLKTHRSLLERLVSPLALTGGAVTISGFLTAWADDEYAALHSAATATEVPILVDVDEVVPAPYPRSTQHVLYSASAGYHEALAFVIAAMQGVWDRWPECRLVVTGMTAAQLERALLQSAHTGLDTTRVVAAGHVSRDALLQLYAEASACLAPLFDDRRSRARFPTKIAEYAAAARPVVTSRVGEVERFLEDGVTAFIAEPGDAVAFGEQIARVLADRDAAAATGLRARAVAERCFDYRVHAAALHRALACAPVPRRPG